ncbi:MAG: 30S ribosomal protein S4 [Firmicutes bacterium]|nr:30S ribosomal protein S4 [Bacillota bacterium]
MARYTGPDCKLCRREGMKLYLKGERCYSPKCAIDRRPVPPGMHGPSRKKQSEYGIQLREKQKARRMYGVLEGQFEHYFEKADRMKGVTGENLLSLLERRLDNIIYRVGLGTSRTEARQLVRHGHFTVNGRKVNIASFQVRAGDVVAVRDTSKSSPRLKELAEYSAARTIPQWLSYEPEALRITVLRVPRREEIDTPVQEQMIVELYSR